MEVPQFIFSKPLLTPAPYDGEPVGGDGGRAALSARQAARPRLGGGDRRRQRGPARLSQVREWRGTNEPFELFRSEFGQNSWNP